jgi:uroporphyrin-III C-methyltransferase
MNKGKVYLIGAGPGDPELLSIAGYRAILDSKAVIMDHLLQPDFLERLGIPCKQKVIHHLGDANTHWSQKEISRTLLHFARNGWNVARLKGGDPFVFGRGFEEMKYLSDHAVPYEIIPGMSAATAVPAAAGLSLTHRESARSFAVVTAKTIGGEIHKHLPRADSLVIMMGVAALEAIVEKLLSDGWNSCSPAAIIERGTLTWERHVQGPLGRIVALAREHSVRSPACIVVGEVARTPHRLQPKPTILFTGIDPTAFRSLGTLIHWPALKVIRNQAAEMEFTKVLEDLQEKRFSNILFCDSLGVNTFFRMLGESEADARVFGGTHVTAANAMVRRSLFSQRISPDDTGMSHHALHRGRKDGEVLLVAGTHLPGRLHDIFLSNEKNISSLLLNRLVFHPELGRSLPQFDAAYFVSPRGVEAYAQSYGCEVFQGEVWCLGEATRIAASRWNSDARVVIPQAYTSSDRFEMI